jgi:lipid II:glycine glycyltransferase (peptidoglycan interpeptide bridge formation enzyme)
MQVLVGRERSTQIANGVSGSGTPHVVRHDVAAVKRDLQVDVVCGRDDPDWDLFLMRTSGASHVQSSLWGELKKQQMAYCVVRVSIRRAGQIVAGAQMLVRHVACVGRIAYVPKGPVVGENDLEISHALLEALKSVARSERIRLLIVQPVDPDLAQRLPGRGFSRSPLEISLNATCVLDLSESLEELLARMKPRTRYNIGLARRKGVKMRQGAESDLPEFYGMLVATGRRQGFPVYPQTYYHHLWRLFGERGLMRIGLVECQGEVVAGQLAICFGDTVVNKMSVWSGNHANHRPNEFLQWCAIEWAKEQGFRWYDFDGIDPAAARAVLEQGSLPEHWHQTVASFKLGFGAQPVLFQGTFDYVSSPALRWAYRTLISPVLGAQRVRRVVYHLRTRRAKAQGK